ncbi:CENP-Q, a CENPA-CAD centromere complex subunit-domain-containing protein [Chaetomium strumarium]|uniref:CENP-Q, a CENPA-CAD centromere complex subunit-domain-containing protein n=1 Tax=Chaetomium strumarium TaxID=1170767 RepID=A0AAJ0M0M4_9PEZI|nr:CENP-Q, a CENPA-CAD centromere complex subunit-domain-containing protein [Chaetomium strumarium]
MAPGEPNQKRKRGRPPAASKTSTPNATEPVQEQPGIEQSAKDTAAPKRRGRPHKSIDTESQNEPQPAQVEADQASSATVTAPKKRGRPPVARETEAQEADTVQPPPRKRRRAGETPEANNGRDEGEMSKSAKSNKTSGNAAQQVTESGGPSVAEASKRRGRRGRQLDTSPAEPLGKDLKTNKGRDDGSKGKLGRKPAVSTGQGEEEEQAAEDRSVRQSRRGRRSADDDARPAANQASLNAANGGREVPVLQGRKRGRPSLAELSAREAQNNSGPSQPETQGQKRERGRPRVASDEGDATSQNTRAPSAKPAKQSKKQASSPSQETEPASRRGRRRSANEPPSPHAEQPAGPPTKYRHLAARTRQVPHSTISSKWAPLDTPAITAIESILTDATRPVLHRLRDRDQRHAQAQTILRMFTSRLRSKLVKGMPFPPPASTTSSKGKKGGEGGHAAELDFERTVDGIGRLEKALDPLLHSVVLLRGEKEREERALEREYKLLRRLEANARAQVRGWKEGRGREHVLVAGVRGHEEGEAEWRGLEIVKGVSGGRSGVFKDLEEEELLALSRQIGNHMESMRSNLGQIESVLPAIAKSRAALQGTLCEHLDPEQYEQVLLG